MTKSQIDRLGQRLKTDQATEDDLTLLDEYRRSYAESYRHVIQVIRQNLGYEPTGRLAKSTLSIVQKLRRESVRLSQIQDIAGCRIIVDDVHAQQNVVDRLCRSFDRATTVDRRIHPSHGYRAVHVVVESLDKLVEVQVRTALQQLWAELSEKLADIIDPAIKYGGGPEWAAALLAEISSTIAEMETLDLRLANLTTHADQLPDEDRGWLAQTRRKLVDQTHALAKSLDQIKNLIRKGENP